MTGVVTLGYEKTNEELLKLQQEFKKLETKHHKLLEKKNYYKFKKGPVFYIISDTESNCIKFKPGIETENINIRMAAHRSSFPGVKLEYLIYTKDCALLEKSILKRYKSKRNFKNHEYIYDIDKKHIIDSVKTLLEFLSISYTEEVNLELYNTQIENDIQV